MSVRLRMWIALAGALAVALGAAQGAAAVAKGQVDTFEDGTTEGWRIGLELGAPTPANVASGGPDGADDAYLLLTSHGQGGAGSRLVALNTDAWAGDYRAAGIEAIEMQVANFGTTELALRLYFEDVAPGSTANTAASTLPVLLPAGSDWMPVVFPIGPGDMTPVFGSVEAALANAGALRIYHSPTATFPGPEIAAQLGVDDIRAVPEPARGLLGAAALGALTRRRSA